MNYKLTINLVLFNQNHMSCHIQIFHKTLPEHRIVELTHRRIVGMFGRMRLWQDSEHRELARRILQVRGV